MLRTGCQWKAFLKERFGSASSVGKNFREWRKAGFFCDSGWQVYLNATAWKACLEVAKHRQLNGQGSPGSRIRRSKHNGPGKNGSKRHVLVDGNGIPLSLIVTGANRHDVIQIAPLLDAPIFTPPGGNLAYL